MTSPIRIVLVAIARSPRLKSSCHIEPPRGSRRGKYESNCPFEEVKHFGGILPEDVPIRMLGPGDLPRHGVGRGRRSIERLPDTRLLGEGVAYEQTGEFLVRLDGLPGQRFGQVDQPEQIAAG